VFALTATTPAEKNAVFRLFGTDSFTILDAIDIVNPLQHLPVIGPLYREFTGDNLDPFSRIAGNTLFFGPFGTAFSSINIAVEGITGKDVGSNIMAMFKDENTDPAKPQTPITNRVDPKMPSINQNKPTDPVLAWAAAEINYRNSEALKQDIHLPTRPYSKLVASITPTRAHPTQTTPVSARPEPKKLRQGPAEHISGQAQKSKELFQHEFLALNTLNNDLLALPTTLQQIKRRTNAYTSLTAHTNQSSDKLSAKHVGQKTHVSKTSQTQPHGTISKNGGWFSTSMNDALSKYHQAKGSKLFRENASIPLASSLR